LLPGRHHKEKIIICGILLPEYYKQINEEKKFSLPEVRAPKVVAKGVTCTRNNSY